MYAIIDQIREQRLIAAAKRGDRSAFDALCRHHRTAVVAFVGSRVSIDKVDDVVQDVWMTGWQRLHSYAFRSTYRSWVLGIAVNKIREARRKPIEYTNIEDHSVNRQAAGQKSEADGIVLRLTVQDALEKLPEAQKEVIELYYFSGLSLPEIAQTLDRNLNTVKYQFYTAHDRVAGSIAPITYNTNATNESREAA